MGEIDWIDKPYKGVYFTAARMSGFGRAIEPWNGISPQNIFRYSFDNVHMPELHPSLNAEMHANNMQITLRQPHQHCVVLQHKYFLFCRRGIHYILSPFFRRRELNIRAHNPNPALWNICLAIYKVAHASIFISGWCTALHCAALTSAWSWTSCINLLNQREFAWNKCI